VRYRRGKDLRIGEIKGSETVDARGDALQQLRLERHALLCLCYKYGELRLQTDCVWGRSMKTEVTIRQDRPVTLTSWGRGQSALRWLDQLHCPRRSMIRAALTCAGG
jgi:hypothetical protein